MSQPKYLEVDQTPVDERNSTHESRSWDKDIVDTPCSGNCLTLLFCLPCSLPCFAPLKPFRLKLVMKYKFRLLFIKQV